MGFLSDKGYNVDGRIEIVLKVDGQETDCSANLISVETRCSAGKIATARITIQEDPQALSEADSEKLPIGSKLEIEMGRDGETSKVFSGIVTDRSLSLGSGGTQLMVAARHEAFRMTLDRKFLCFEEMSDSDIIRTVVGNYGLASEVDNSSVTHEKTVQYNCTDWDFVNLRAEAAGLVLCTAPDALMAKAPDVTKDPVISILNGYSLNKLKIDINGHDRFKSIGAQAWNFSSREMDTSEADPAGNDTPQGAAGSSEMAAMIGNDSRTVRLLGGQYTPDAMEQYLAAEALRCGLSRITGKLSIPGTASVLPLDMVSLEGLGKSFGGNAIVSSVIQNFSGSDWETTLGIGFENIPFRTRYTDIDSPLSDGVSAASFGLQIAIVEAIEGDPQGEERIKVRLMGNERAAVWARVSLPYAGDGRGFVFMPEVGDEVIVGFMGGNPSEAVVLGSMHSSAAASPSEKSDDNDIKSIVTREGVKIEIDDKKKELVIQTPGGNSILLSDDRKAVAIQDQNGNKVTLDSNGITLESAKDLVLNATGDLKGQGVNINMEANAQLSVKGTASAEINSSGNTVVKGSVVQIN